MTYSCVCPKTLAFPIWGEVPFGNLCFFSRTSTQLTVVCCFALQPKLHTLHGFYRPWLLSGCLCGPPVFEEGGDILCLSEQRVFWAHDTVEQQRGLAVMLDEPPGLSGQWWISQGRGPHHAHLRHATLGPSRIVSPVQAPSDKSGYAQMSPNVGKKSQKNFCAWASRTKG